MKAAAERSQDDLTRAMAGTRLSTSSSNEGESAGKERFYLCVITQLCSTIATVPAALPKKSADVECVLYVN